MPRYYFDICDGEDVIPDDEGLDLDDIGAARLEAQRTIVDLAVDVFQGDERELVITVRSEGGPVLRLRLLLVVEPLV